jgi:hypothetical protein
MTTGMSLHNEVAGRPPRIRYVQRWVDRRPGRTHYYFRRRGKVTKKIALPGIPGSPEFMAAYQAALAGGGVPESQQLADAALVRIRNHAEGEQAQRLIYKGDVVYFLEAGDFIKIGFTTSLENRIKALETSSPHEFVVLATMPGTIEDETEIHHRFWSSRQRREWFRKTPELLAFIDQIAGKVT